MFFAVKNGSLQATMIGKRQLTICCFVKSPIWHRAKTSHNRDIFTAAV